MITTKLHPAFNSPIDDDVDGIRVNHNAILADLIECNFSLAQIARNHGLNLAQLIAWAAQKPVRDLLDAADELAARVATHKAAQGRGAAIQTLLGQARGLCETPREQDLASRAARALLRLGPDRKHRGSSAKRWSRHKAIAEAAGAAPPSAGSAPAHLLRFPVYPFRPQPNTGSEPIHPTGRFGAASPDQPNESASSSENASRANGASNGNGTHHPP